MARPILLELPTRDPRELHSRLDKAPGRNMPKRCWRRTKCCKACTTGACSICCAARIGSSDKVIEILVEEGKVAGSDPACGIS